jgi:hypothetical protein
LKLGTRASAVYKEAEKATRDHVCRRLTEYNDPADREIRGALRELKD